MTKSSLSQEYMILKAIISFIECLLNLGSLKCVISCELDMMSSILQMTQLVLRSHTLRNSGRFELWTHVWLRTSQPYATCLFPYIQPALRS